MDTTLKTIPQSCSSSAQPLAGGKNPIRYYIAVLARSQLLPSAEFPFSILHSLPPPLRCRLLQLMLRLLPGCFGSVCHKSFKVFCLHCNNKGRCLRRCYTVQDAACRRIICERHSKCRRLLTNICTPYAVYLTSWFVVPRFSLHLRVRPSLRMSLLSLFPLAWLSVNLSKLLCFCMSICLGLYLPVCPSIPWSLRFLQEACQRASVGPGTHPKAGIRAVKPMPESWPFL